MEHHIAGHTGKVTYKTEAEAESIAIRQTGKWDKKCRPYICPLGGHWHITTMSKGRFYTSQRKDPRSGERASNIPK